MRCVLAVLLAAGLALPPWAVAQTVSVLTPANASTTYNTNPWVTFTETVSNTPVNNAEVQVCNNTNCTTPPSALSCSASAGFDYWACCTNSSCTGSAAGCSYGTPAKFYPMGAGGSGSQVTFRAGCTLNTGTWYLRARIMDNVGTWGAWSSVNTFTVAATPTWNQTVTAGKSVIRVGDFTELRTYTDNVRAARGSGAATYTNTTLAAGKVIHAVDITQMQSAFDTPFFYVTGSHIYSGSFISGKCGLTTIPCDINSTFNTVTSGTTQIRACHINDIRTLFTNCSP